jgi:hypothetical protein
MACSHRQLEIKTEKDRCSWVKCKGCRKRGPKKHSVVMALMAFAVSLGDRHPRARR